MSLDIYLYTEVDLGGEEPYRVDIWDRNMTHNLGKMAEECGLYQPLWRPEELFQKSGILPDDYKADYLVLSLEAGLNRLKDKPKKYKKFNPDNGWGNYDILVNFVEELLENCKLYPLAKIESNR